MKKVTPWNAYISSWGERSPLSDIKNIKKTDLGMKWCVIQVDMTIRVLSIWTRPEEEGLTILGLLEDHPG